MFTALWFIGFSASFRDRRILFGFDWRKVIDAPIFFVPANYSTMMRLTPAFAVTRSPPSRSDMAVLHLPFAC
jgi:hypothetical protein